MYFLWFIYVNLLSVSYYSKTLILSPSLGPWLLLRCFHQVELKNEHRKHVRNLAVYIYNRVVSHWNFTVSIEPEYTRFSQSGLITIACWNFFSLGFDVTSTSGSFGDFSIINSGGKLKLTFWWQLTFFIVGQLRHLWKLFLVLVRIWTHSSKQLVITCQRYNYVKSSQWLI